MKTMLLLLSLTAPHDRADWVNYASGVVDSAVTCRYLANGAREGMLPTQSCAGVTAFIMGGKATETVIAHKCRQRWCRAIPWVAAGGSGFAVGYSIANFGHRK